MVKSVNGSRVGRRRVLFGAGLTAGAVATAGVAGVAGAAAMPSSGRADRSRREPEPEPLVVLVHGAFADAGSWSGVIERLRHCGVQAIAPANPLRDLKGDAAYLASIAGAVPGPVVLVGHSYGGAVITNAARSMPNVKALVYVAAFAPDQDESVASLSERFPKTPLVDATRPQSFPLPDGGTGTEVYIDREKFADVFAQDIPGHRAAVLAATQRPIAETALIGGSGEPAWKNLPSSYQISTRDHALHPDAQRFFAKRMNAEHVIELDSSHASAIAHPGAVTRLIRRAVRAVHQ